MFFIQKTKINIENAFPIVITFLPNNFRFVDNVPVIPINELNSFLLDFECINHDIYKI